MLLYVAWNEQYQDTTFVLEIIIVVIIELFVATYYLGMGTVLNFKICSVVLIPLL